MIFLFIFCNSYGNVLAGPLPPLYPSEIPLYPRDIDLTGNLFIQRSRWSIIWGCFATLFACSWVAIHPNIPAKSDSRKRRFLRRLMIMAYMLIVPEFVILWAARQWFAAREIANKHKDQGWTRTHGFFLAMGGFILCDKNDNMIETLSIERLENLASEGEIHWPSISADEIEDKSKGDVFSKGFTVLQTTWFITQCVARGVSGLTVTELEVVTLAFAALNGALYFLWWNKPQDVGCPVMVHLRLPACKRETGMQTMDLDQGENLDNDPSSIHLDFSRMAGVVLKSDDNEDPSRQSRPLESHPSAFARYSSYFQRFGNMVLSPFRMFWLPVEHMIHCTSLSGSPPLSVPTFYAPYNYNTLPAGTLESSIDRLWYHDRIPGILVASIAATVFGGIHWIAMFFSFQSVEEEQIWTYSTEIMTTDALTSVCFFSFITFFEPRAKRYFTRLKVKLLPLQSRIMENSITHYIGCGLVLFTFVTYFISRAALLILPLIALRSLPPDSLLDINWSSFIPHIH